MGKIIFVYAHFSKNSTRIMLIHIDSHSEIYIDLLDYNSFGGWFETERIAFHECPYFDSKYIVQKRINVL